MAGAEAGLFINGRFLTQKRTGVQRFAFEIVGAIDDLITASEPDTAVELLTPPGAREHATLRTVRQRAVGIRRGQVWEQLSLPAAARGGKLLSLCNTAPLGHREQFVTIHDAGVFANPRNFSWRFRAWYAWLYARLRKRRVRVLTVSEFSKSELVRWCRFPADRIDVVPNGCDHILRVPADPRCLEEHRLVPGSYVLCVGWQTTNKNVGLVAGAVARLADTGLRIVAVGAMDPRVFRRQDARTLGSVEALGHVDDGVLRSLYENALCLVFPSLYEGFGIPPLEAMACGCPAIVARSSALPESCGDAALYCDPKDPTELIAHLEAVRSDAALRARLCAAGRARAKQFTWARSARRILDLVCGPAGPHS